MKTYQAVVERSFTGEHMVHEEVVFTSSSKKECLEQAKWCYVQEVSFWEEADDCKLVENVPEKMFLLDSDNNHFKAYVREAI